MKALNGRNDNELADNVAVADTLISRMKGLLGTTSLPAGHGLLIKPCNSIHTIGMRFPIDVVFLDKRNSVVAVREMVVPNRLTRIFAGAASVLELPAGTINKTATKTGDMITLL